MSSRRILFLSGQLKKLGVGREASGLDIRDVEVDLYEDVRKLLRQYGKLDFERTSGHFPRLDTPAEGVPRPTQTSATVFEPNPERHASTAIALADRQKNALKIQQQLLNLIDGNDYIVAAVDGESETRGSLIQYAHGKGKPILLLQKEVQIILSTRPLYHNRPGITYVVYKDFDSVPSGARSDHPSYQDLRHAVHKFFNRLPSP